MMLVCRIKVIVMDECIPFTKRIYKNIKVAANEPSADNAGGFRWLAFTKPSNDIGKVNIKQVKPSLRLPAGRYAVLILKILLRLKKIYLPLALVS